MSEIIELPRVTLAQASTRPHLDFVLPGLLAGSVGMVVGQGAVGKSFLALQIGLAIASGRAVAGGLWSPGGTGPVTMIFGEDKTDILQERLYWLRQQEGIGDDEAAQTDEKLDIRSGYGFDMRIIAKTRDGIEDGPFYKTLLSLARGQRAITIDPLVFLSGGDGENDNGVMTHLMRVLQRVARETGCTIIVLHHTSKGGEGEREEWTAARGASALTTAVRWQVNLRPPKKEECEELGIGEDERGTWVRVAVTKSNYGETPPAGWVQRTRGGILRFRQFSAAVKAAARKYASKKGGGDEIDPWSL